MGKLFGTDGIRGVAGLTLTAETAFHIGQAVSAVLEKETGRTPFITIGMDTRISSEMLESALVAGICSVGGNALPLGVIPTPAVAFLTVEERADAGIVISASHNPYEYNGIKVFNSRGYKLPDAVERKVEELVLADKIPDQRTGSMVGRRYPECNEPRDRYIAHLLSTIDADTGRLRVLVDCANGAASTTAPVLFSRLDLQADFIHASPDGININSGCGSTHLESLARGVVKGGYDLGIAFDGDADRCLLADEKGGIIDGDKVMAVCALMLRQRGLLHRDTVVATVLSNLGLHEFCRKNGMHLVCTPVGDRNVLEKMAECDYSIGGEQSGHTIFRDYATTGDGELTALQFLQALCLSGGRASQLTECFTEYPQEMINVELPHTAGLKERIMSDETLQLRIRESEKTLHGGGRILIRPSGTESIIRVMVEAGTDDLALNTAQSLAEYIKKLSK